MTQDTDEKIIYEEDGIKIVYNKKQDYFDMHWEDDNPDHELFKSWDEDQFAEFIGKTLNDQDINVLEFMP